MAEYIVNWKENHPQKNLTTIGIGGVTSVDEYFLYKKIGVDAVQSATGAMWNPHLAIDIRKSLMIKR
jgi:dihydroorotate dehydrogenase (NAD+) catalytic subunit